jgi:hypothetical protein
MVLPPAGNPIGISNIKNEYAPTKSVPHRVGEFYRGGPFVSGSCASSAIPASGAISLSNFYGTQNPNPGQVGVYADAWMNYSFTFDNMSGVDGMNLMNDRTNFVINNGLIGYVQSTDHGGWPGVKDHFMTWPPVRSLQFYLYSGWFVPKYTGTWQFLLFAQGACDVVLELGPSNVRVVCHRYDTVGQFGHRSQRFGTPVQLQGCQAYRFNLRYYNRDGLAFDASDTLIVQVRDDAGITYEVSSYEQNNNTAVVTISTTFNDFRLNGFKNASGHHFFFSNGQRWNLVPTGVL